jgi:hypothetical protein
MNELIKAIYGDKAGEAITAIKNYEQNGGTPPDQLLRVIYSGMGRIRVLGRVDKSLTFAKNPALGVFRNFSTKMITAIFHRGFGGMIKGYRTGDTEMLKNSSVFTMKLIVSLMVAGASQQMIKDLIRGSFDDDEWEKKYVLDAFWNIFFLSNYTVDMFKGGSITMGTIGTIFPVPWTILPSFAETFVRDIDADRLFDLEEGRTLRRIPIIGDIVRSTFQRE